MSSLRNTAKRLREKAEELVHLAEDLEQLEAPKPKKPRREWMKKAPRLPTEIEMKRAEEELRKLSQKGYKVG